MALKPSPWLEIRDLPGRLAAQLLDTSLYHLYTLWLFTFSDMKTILFPQTAFGIITTISQTQSNTTLDVDGAYDILKRSPLVMFWVWIHLLPLDIHNQQQPNAIFEDKVNKPWRPLPANRCTLTQARLTIITLYAIAGLVSYHLGPVRWSLSIVILGTWYNSFGGSDMNLFIRNMLNALGYASFGLGALEIAQDGPLSFEIQGGAAASHFPSLESWVVLLTLVILITIQYQDMEDQEGDILRGRLSLPLQIGDGPTRVITAILMSIWGVLCPYFWDCNWIGYAMTTSLAYLVVLRSLMYRTVEADKVTYRIWNLWLVGLYLLPVVRV
ncbi:UbiA prenyltransferase family [Astrocystis sublimbata]|nr:UbiA prenyltransferase family [Astrocystis sublimbata]